jgi:hypothetical protein
MPRAAKGRSGSATEVLRCFQSFIYKRTPPPLLTLTFTRAHLLRAHCQHTLQLMDCIHVVSPVASARVFFDSLSSEGPSRASVVKADGVCDDAFSAALSGQMDWHLRLMRWLQE